MKVQDKKIDELNLELTIGIDPADYQEAEKKKLSDCRRKADFKGFRKGMVPMSMIQRLYGDQCLVEAVNRVVSEALDNYIRTGNLHILGEPMTSEGQPELEWKSGNEFTFIFDLGLAPEVNVEVEATDEVPSYNVTVTAKDKAPMIESLKKYYEEKKEEEAEPKTDEEIEKEVTERLKEQYKNEAGWRVSKDIRDFYVSKANLALPEAFLKRWLVSANEGKFTQEDIEKEFPGFCEDLKWQLVRGSLMQKWELKVEEEDILKAAQEYVAYQYAAYGMSLPEDMIKDAALNILHDQKQVERLVEQVEDQKTLAKIKETITLKPTKIGAAKFRDLK